MVVYWVGALLGVRLYDLVLLLGSLDSVFQLQGPVWWVILVFVDVDQQVYSITYNYEDVYGFVRECFWGSFFSGMKLD